MIPIAGLLDAAKVLKRLRSVRGQDDAVEAGRGVTI